MKDDRPLEELSARIRDLLAQSPARDVEKNLKALLSAGFSRLDLVTREDFEAQRRVLERAQARIADLEARLEALESSTPRV